MKEHDKWGFMTDEFRQYSQADWDAVRDTAEGIAKRAIADGVSPIAMKDLLISAIDCGVTLAMAQARVDNLVGKA